jgi:hypothetical protein
MIKKLIILIILATILCVMTDARLPKKGDNVMIGVNSGAETAFYEGEITDIDTNMICLNVNFIQIGNGPAQSGDKPEEMCKGMGAIIALRYETIT